MLPSIVIVGDPSDPRHLQWAQACTRLSLGQPRYVPYTDVVARLENLEELFHPEDVVRIDTPGRSFATYQALLRAGIEASQQRGERHAQEEEIDRLTDRRGEILCPTQWFRGFSTVVQRLGHVAGIRLPMPPRDILTMFDKRECNELLRTSGIPVPRALPSVTSYDELRSAMAGEGMSRVFIKLRYGSSASAMVAYQRMGERELVYTTAEIDGNRLFGTRKVRRLVNGKEIGALIDAVCDRGVHVEQWIPKAGIDGRTCDLRVISINGSPFLSVARLSRSPFTNLHLGGQRSDTSALQARCSRDRWDYLNEICTAAHRVFSSSIQVGLDVTLTADFASVYVLEVNAFGDFVKVASPVSPQEAQLASLCSSGSCP